MVLGQAKVKERRRTCEGLPPLVALRLCATKKPLQLGILPAAQLAPADGPGPEPLLLVLHLAAALCFCY